MFEELKHEAIRTPLERPLLWLRRGFEFRRRRLHPELREIFLEDERIQTVLRRFLRPESCCLDIGCHYGSMLSRFCRLAPAGRHVAFEAVPAKVRFLRRKFPDVDVREVALSDHSGSAAFYLNRDATGYSGLAPNGEGSFHRFQVSCARLDDVVPRDRRFDFVKIDVEGAELLVLRGASQLLARDRPVVLFECGPGGPSAFGYTPAALYDFLTGVCGYSIFFLKDILDNGAPVTLAEFESALIYPFKAFNWIGIPKGSLPGPTLSATDSDAQLVT